jgi:hypothetical protein
LAPVTDTTRKALVVSGVVALIGSIAGLILGLIMVNNLSDYLTQSVAVSESALGAVEETLGVLESVAVEVDEGMGAAGASIAAASEAVLTAAGELDDVADFLDGDLQTSIEALLDTMPAAIQTAGVIDGTLSALSFLGVDYDPDQSFDASLSAVEDALEPIPPQLSAQADTIRALVPVSQQFAEDAAATAEAFDALRVELASSQQLIDSYRATVDQAQSVIASTASSLSATTWLLRLIVVLMTVTGSAIAIGLIILGRSREPVVAAGFDEATDG